MDSLGKRKKQQPENETDGEFEGRLEDSEGINDTGTTATGLSNMDSGEDDDRGGADPQATSEETRSCPAERWSGEELSTLLMIITMEDKTERVDTDKGLEVTDRVLGPVKRNDDEGLKEEEPDTGDQQEGSES